MTTRVRKCEAQGGPANCTDPNCPQKRAFYAEYAQLAPAPTSRSVARRRAAQRPIQVASAEGNFTSRACRKIAEEMRAHGTQQNYMHEIMLHSQTKPGYLLAVTRDEQGPSGYMEFHVERSPIMPEVVVHNVRARESYQEHGGKRNSRGTGLALLQHAAQVALAQKDPKTVLTIQGAVESARPFYAKMGGQTSATNSMVHFSREATEALAAGKPLSLQHAE